MIGPVQENDTSTRVSAMKKIPMKLVVPARASDRFIQEDGRLISKAPRNEIPKIRNNAKNTRLAIQFVARLFSAAGPKTMVIKKPSRVKMITMEAA